MADQVLKLSEIEDFFFQVTCKMLNIDLTKEENQDKVRIAWATNGAPGWKINDDVIFIRVTPQDDRMTRHLNIMYTHNEEDNQYLKKSVGYTRVHKIDWCLYGPNSYDNADIIRYKIFDFEFMKEFKNKNLFLITDVPMPTRLPELYNGQWWERTDFSATFNEGVIRETKESYITSANVELIKDR